MAKANSTKATRPTRAPKRTGVSNKSALPLRASEREGIKLEVSSLSESGRALRNMMTEQSKAGGQWFTYYTGTQAEFFAAGIPEHLFASHERPVRFRANGQDASLQRKEPVYELTLRWDYRGPWYYNAQHPALSELGRMIHIDVHNWLSTEDDRRKRASEDTFEVPVEKLLADQRAVDYQLSPSKRFRFAKDFRPEMFSLISALTHAVHNAEIMPLQAESVAVRERPVLHVVK